MSPLLQPLHLLLTMFAGWVNRHQLDLIDYLQEENRLLFYLVDSIRLWLLTLDFHLNVT